MSLAKETTRCPFCKEPISIGAIRCKHCHADLVSREEKKKSYFAKYDNFRAGFIGGVVFSIVIAALAYWQFAVGE
jgi:hypothetical protein